jgi:hypothetical protein
VSRGGVSEQHLRLRAHSLGWYSLLEAALSDVGARLKARQPLLATFAMEQPL